MRLLKEMIIDFFQYGVANLRKRRIRTWLTMIGIFIGIAAVVSLVSLGQGLQKYVDDEFQKLGRDKIIIEPKGTLGGIADIGGAKLDDSDLKIIKKTSGVVDASGMNFKAAKVKFNDKTRYYPIISMPQGKEGELVKEMFSSYGIETGRDLKDGDKKKIVLGHYFFDRNLFEKNVKLGDKIEINDVVFDVVGFYTPVGNPSDDTQMYITQDEFFELFDIEKGDVNYIFAKADKSQNPLVVADRIEKELRKHRNVKEGNEDFTVTSFQEYAKAFLKIFNIVQVVIVGIAGISLIVGGIGIMNTMFTAVLQRTQEIGIMKSIGAKNSDIMILFLIESGILGLVGGGIGVIVGMGIAKSIELIATFALQTTLLQAYFPWYLIVGSLMFSFIVGALSGVVPAYQASKLKPVDALRYE
jgi:putative ABC transport system permease protein